MQDTLPAHSRSFSQECQHSAEEIEHKVTATQQKTMSYYVQQNHTSPFRYQAGITSGIAKSQDETLEHVWYCHFC